MKTFTDHNGKTHSGKQLLAAIDSVCDERIALYHRIRVGDAYASHVTEAQKDEILRDNIDRMEQVRNGAKADKLGYKVWFLQLLDHKLTGECVALLP